MQKRSIFIESVTHAVFVVALSLSLNGFARSPGGGDLTSDDVVAVQQHEEHAVPKPANTTAAPAIQISFKLDSWITAGMYLGERWVSPLTYNTAQNGRIGNVEATVHGLDDRGKPTNLTAEWIPTDPDMVTITPLADNKVRITVKRVGESSLHVSCEGVSRKLCIKAGYLHDSIQVQIVQPASGISTASAGISSRPH